WKGPKVGARIRIVIPVSWPGAEFPLALCGERYFMTAYNSPPSKFLDWSGGGGVPYWWRDIRPDHGLPMWQGRELIVPGTEKKGELPERLAKLERAIALGPAQQEE